MKILVAEDNATSAKYLCRTLERMGHEVTVVVDGAAAWEAVQAGPVPLLISDWMMPGLDGPELCRRIRAREGDLYTYVVLLTSKDLRGDRLEGLRAGADDFLTKPPDAEELAVRLEIAGRILAVHEALARQNERLAELASVDGLTGVKNRRRFDEGLEFCFSLWARKGATLSLLMLDVDHFKPYNDTYGHQAGDVVLRTIGGLLGETTREHDIVARYGGEEFAVLLPSTPGDDAAVVAERLRARIEQHPWPLRAITASLGFATTGPDTPTAAALMAAADRCLYASKHAGRNRVTRHTSPVGDKPAD